jgi:DNA repair exonuclease SbcCD ATPase subunit
LKLTCPHKDHINSQGAANEKEAKRLKVVYDSKLKAYTSDKQALEQLQQENRERVQHAEKLKMSEVKLESALAAKKWLKENERPEVEAADIENAMETTRRIGEVQNAIKASNTASKQRDKLKAEHAAVHEQQLRLRAATAVLGRNGAQRVIADRALSTIEASGNEMLVRAGVPLNFKISWKEETSQPASECEKCGNAFPSSVKVKECTRCGEPRGRKMSEKLRVRLSDRSGGADAIAGVMFKLAAAHWYREYHGLGWPIFMVDEPFGALDKANVKALSNHISKLLEYFDAEQAFIIDHHAEVLDSMPARITLVGVGRRHTKVLSVASG